MQRRQKMTSAGLMERVYRGRAQRAAEPRETRTGYKCSLSRGNSPQLYLTAVPGNSRVAPGSPLLLGPLTMTGLLSWLRAIDQPSTSRRTPLSADGQFVCAGTAYTYCYYGNIPSLIPGYYREMPHAPRSPTNCAGMQTKLSAWTPLNHPLTNSKVFEERRTLLKKWFDRWSASQRTAVLQDLVLSCSREQLKFLSLSVSRQLPLQAADFACQLPRALCLYIFSFLDPRSLCRCAQVSWHWKSLVELDQLWMPKCLRLGWCIGFSLTPFEQGAWKRHYVQTVQELRLLPQQAVMPEATGDNSGHEPLAEAALLTEERPVSTVQRAGRSLRFGSIKDKRATTLPPWRDADRRPKDTLRFNYLDNLQPASQALRGQMNITANTCRGNASESADGRRKPLSEATYKLRKAKSLMFISSGGRPQHPPPPPAPAPLHQTKTPSPQASCGDNHPITKETTRSLLSLAQWNAGVRPGPVRSPVPRLSLEALRASQRSNRSSPSVPLFEFPSWNWPASHAR